MGLVGETAPGQVDMKLLSPRALCALLAVQDAVYEAERNAHRQCGRDLASRW
eukprot:CAMPEP_0206137562 /NCGR_PEP_ID=MMETSP1473-20131121/2663_1 /ASSEMBLY_ACC=CAM_ASM_001109 /TAXON_ID=1461547 /ORGANISM="Stichococcus sp, Strain RCC1054" /LENGTH=51 /DNA_ID=CAMNT_0053530707 /DNA_START=208 /DNA_END=360 /DNA_ORIENTATION=-